MNCEQLRKRIQAGIDRHCAPLTADPYRALRVLYAAQQEGEQAVKKKHSASFVLALALVLFAVTALAVVTIQETGHLFAQTEQEIGDYIDWPAEKKAAVVCDLMEEGYIKETAERKSLRQGTLTQEETVRIADEAIEELTGEEARYASFLSIMNAVWGPFEQWSQEQKIWYSQVMADTGAQTQGTTVYVEATGSLTEQEAVAIAKKEIARGFDLEESLLEQYRLYEVDFQIPEFAEPGDEKGYWYVAFDTWNTPLEGQEGLPFQAMDVFVDPDTGELLEPIEDIAAAFKAEEERQNAPLSIAIRDFKASINEPHDFLTWTLEHKARWSKEIAPQISEYVRANDDNDPAICGQQMMIFSTYSFGLPDDQAISQEQAMNIAQDTLADVYGLSDEEWSLLTANKRSPSVFYDVTCTEQPRWMLLFTMPSIYDPDETIVSRVKALYDQDTHHDRFFLIEISAYDGAIIRSIAEPCLPDLLAAF